MKRNTVAVSIAMPPELALQLRIAAAVKNESRSKFVCDMLTATLAKNKPEHDKRLLEILHEGP